MATLKEIIDQTSELESIIEQSGGELTPELEQALEQVTKDLEAKIDGYGYLMRKMKSNIDASKQLIKDMQATVKAKENGYNRLKDHIAYVMNMRNDRRLEGSTFTASLRTTTSLEVDEDAIIAPYKADIDALNNKLPKWIDIKPSVSKTELKVEFPDDESLPAGAKYKTSNTVTIK